jgi:RNA polymerase sigma factor (sigma-70 family)
MNRPANPVLRHVRRVALAGTAGDLTDEFLLWSFVRCQDEAAFEALVRRHGPMVLSVCRRILNDPHDADDAFQAAFLVLVRRAATIEKRNSLGNWLHGVALRTALKARAVLATRRKHEKRAVPVPAEYEESQAVRRDLRSVLDEEIQHLPEPYRTLVVLCYLEGKSYGEAAGHLGCSRGTVSTRLTKARTLLRNRLVRRGVTLSAGTTTSLLVARRLTAAPGSLVRATVRAATGFTVSDHVVSLTEGVLKAMSLTRLKNTLVVLFLGAILAGGTYLVQYQLHAEEPLDVPHAALVGDKSPDNPPGAAHVLAGHGERVTWVSFAPDGRRAISSSLDRTVRLWEVETGKELRRLTGHTDRVECAGFSPDGRRALSCAWDGTIRLWDLETGKQLKCFDAVGAPGVHIARVAFLPDGKHFLCCPLDHHSLQVRDAETGEVLKEFGRHRGHVNTVALSPDGRQVLEASCDVRLPVRLWDLETGKLLREFKGHPEEVRGVALSPDGHLALSAGALGGLIRL